MVGAVSLTPGADLSEAFYVEAVRPLLVDLPHAAGVSTLDWVIRQGGRISGAVTGR